MKEKKLKEFLLLNIELRLSLISGAKVLLPQPLTLQNIHIFFDKELIKMALRY